MDYRVLGRTGVKMSPLCLGGDNFLNPTSEEESVRLIQRALDGGINFIDTSNSYMQGESERIIGAALKASGRRQQTILATKVHYPVGPGPNDRGNSRLHIIRACEDSLRRLGTDYVDLYQTHRPDFDVPLEETLGALTGSPLVTQDRLICGSEDNYIYGLNPATGKQIYRMNAESEVLGTPLIIQDRLIFTARMGRIYAMKPDYGKLHWTYQHDHLINSSPASDGDSVFIGLDSGELLRLPRAIGPGQNDVPTVGVIPGGPGDPPTIG